MKLVSIENSSNVVNSLLLYIENLKNCEINKNLTNNNNGFSE